MKLKTSITIIAGCFGIFLFIMLPIFLSIQSDKEKYVASFKGSKFSLKDMNNNVITQHKIRSVGPISQVFPLNFYILVLVLNIKVVEVLGNLVL